MDNPHQFTVFEHHSLVIGRVYGKNTFTEQHHKLLENFYKEKNFPFYSLIRHGVRFCSYVGVLQIGPLTIEVLPKADQAREDEQAKGQWRDLLIGMLQAVGVFNIQAPSSSSLKLQANSILDLYLALYLKELEYLLHRGLVKRYRKIAGNTTALKGSLQFSKHIQQNLVHQERFYVRYTTYDAQHLIHGILYKALRLVRQINTKAAMQSSIGALLLNFPEMPDLQVTEATFEKITHSRKDEHYQKALAIARLLLLNYHPDVSKGRNHVLALMFDMNLLWEQFVYATLRQEFRKRNLHHTLSAQSPKYFWQPTIGSSSKMKPDIVINHDKEHCLLLDTKWKNLSGANPSPEDLRQMYVYHEYFAADKVMLVYPGEQDAEVAGHYLDRITAKKTSKECSVLTIANKPNLKAWQAAIAEKIILVHNRLSMAE